MNKKELRQSALQSRRAIPPARIAEMSLRVAANLFALTEFRESRRIASYVAMEDEVQTIPILQRALSDGKSVAVPLVETSPDELKFLEIHALEDLSPGRFGILEPSRTGARVPLSDTDVVLVPVVAWDARGHRIGYGRGYFDRALATRGSSTAIGLAFESQCIASVPDESSDVQLDSIITEKGASTFSREPRPVGRVIR